MGDMEPVDVNSFKSYNSVRIHIFWDYSIIKKNVQFRPLLLHRWYYSTLIHIEIYVS